METGLAKEASIWRGCGQGRDGGQEDDGEASLLRWLCREQAEGVNAIHRDREAER